MCIVRRNSNERRLLDYINQLLKFTVEAFEKRVARRKNRVIDDYGLTSPAEFFAVATESFFEKGAAMSKRLPDLYEQLQRFYAVDPAKWRKRLT